MDLRKRIFALIMSLTMVLTYMPALAFADTDAPAGNEPAVEEDVSEETPAAETPEQNVSAEQDEAVPAEEPAEGPADAEASGAAEEAAAPAEEVTEEDAPAALVKAAPVTQTVTPGTNLADSDDLLEQFLDKEVSDQTGNSVPASPKLKAARSTRGSKLTGSNADIYQTLVPVIKQIAGGTRSSSEMTFPVSLITGDDLTVTAEELGVGSIVDESGEMTAEADEAIEAFLFEFSDPVIDALMADFPYEFYWYDKTAGCTMGSSYYYYSETEISFDSTAVITLGFYVSADYSKSGKTRTTEVDTDRTGAASGFAEYAASLIYGNEDKSDVEKLTAYKDAICDSTAYDSAAAAGGVDYGDPWQMISVFDGDEQTNVVCEGYSKAFQFLCDHSVFSNIRIECDSVTGKMGGGTGAGDHMWNILHMDDGKNYIADITNCDNGTVGAPDKLFLTGATSGSIDAGYEFVIDSNNKVTYAYDDETTALFDASELELSDADYNASEAIDDNQPTAISLTLAADEDGTPRELQAYEFADDVLNFPAEGDTITVTFGSGDNATTKDYIFDEYEWAFMADGIDLADNGTGYELSYYFGRGENGFSPDENGKDILTIEYGRGNNILSAEAEVTIIESDVESLEYSQQTPLVLYRNPEDGKLMELGSYNFVQAGDEMTVRCTDEYGDSWYMIYTGTAVYYRGGWGYELKLTDSNVDGGGYAYPTLIADTSTWTKAGIYPAKVGYEGATADIQVEVRDYPYTKIEFIPADGGITLWSNPLKSTDDQGEVYFDIYKRSPKNIFFIQGDALTLTDSEGKTVEYTFNQLEGEFYDADGNKLPRADALNVYTAQKAKIGNNDANVEYAFLETAETFNITLTEGGDEPFIINSDGMEIDAFRTSDGFAYTAVNSDGGNGVTIIGYNGGESVVNIPKEISGRPVTGFAINPDDPVAGDYSYDNITQINFPESMLYIRTRNLKKFDTVEKFGDFESAGYFASGDVLYKKYDDGRVALGCYPAGRTATEWIVDSRVTESFKAAVPSMKAITKLTLSPNAEYQYMSTLHNMDNIQTVNIPESSTSYASKDGVLYSKDMTELLFYPDKYPQSEFTVPEGVRSFSDEAFDDDCTLRKINLPSTIENVYEDTIDFCSNLQEVAFTGTAIPADPSAFSGIKAAYFEKNIKITYPENVEGYAEFIEKILMAGFEPIPDNPVVLDKSGETTFTIEPGTVTTLKFAPGEKGIYYIDMQTSQDPACEYCFFSSDDHYMRQNGASYAYVLNYDESGNPISYVWAQYLPVEQNDDTMYLQIRLPEGRESLPVTATVRKEQQGIADIPASCEKLVLGQAAEGEVTSADEVVTYEFDTTYFTDNGYTIQLSRAAASDETDPTAQYAVFEKDGIYTLNNEFFSEESIIRTNYNLKEQSSYYIQFRPGIAGPYSIRVTRNASYTEFAEVPESPETIAAGETKQFVIENSGDTATYVLVPEKTADFVFTANGSVDTVGRLLDADKKELAINDDDGDSYNFKIAFRGTAGETYYLQARAYENETGQIEISLSSKEIDHTHTLVRTDAVPATCEEDGTEAYWICSDCGEMFADADGTETIKSPAVIPALGHDWSDWAVTTAPTCTEKGTETRSCSRCDVKGNREVAALGHDFQRVLDTYKAATCEEAGKEADEKCSRCGELHEGAVIPALGHAYGEPGYIWADDNSTVTATIVCAHNAQHTIIETVNTTYVVTLEPTESTEGKGQYTAEFKNALFAPQAKNITIPAIGHVHRLTSVAAHAATCTEDGNVAYWVCDGCGLLFSDENGTQEISAEDVIVKAEGHKAAEAVQENVVSPTCETAGSHDNVVYCSVCNEELSRETVTDEAIGHEYGDWAYADADNHQKVCAHDASHVITEKHSWNEGVVTTQPTQTSAGVRTYTCTVCGGTKTEPIPAITPSEYAYEFCLGGAYGTDTRVIAAETFADGDYSEEYFGVDPSGDEDPIEIAGKQLQFESSDATIATVVQDEEDGNACLVTYTGAKGSTVITAKYNGETVAELTVTVKTGIKMDMSKLDIPFADSYDYNKEMIWPDTTVTYDGQTLREGLDYQLWIYSDESIARFFPEGEYYADKDSYEFPVTINGEGPGQDENAPVKLIWEHNATELRGIIGEDYILGEDFYEEGNTITVVYEDTSKNEVYICKNVENSDYVGYFLNGDTSGDYKDNDFCAYVSEDILTNNGKIVEGQNNTARLKARIGNNTVYSENFTVTGIEDPYQEPGHEHSAATPVEENRVEPTCTEEGSYDEVIYCSECGEELSRESKTIAKIPHTLNKTAAADPTCVEEGNTEYWTCSVCGRHFSDAEGKNEIAEGSWKIPATGNHTWGKAVYEVNDTKSRVTAAHKCSVCGTEESETAALTATIEKPTCEEAGSITYTSGTFEKGFDSWTSDPETIPALGHDWNEPVYRWSADNTSVTATRTCKNDPDHSETETADATSEVTKEATAEEEGSIVWTAAFRNEAFAAQSKEVTLPKIVTVEEGKANAEATLQNADEEVAKAKASSSDALEQAANLDANSDPADVDAAVESLNTALDDAQKAMEAAKAAYEAAQAYYDAAQKALDEINGSSTQNTAKSAQILRKTAKLAGLLAAESVEDAAEPEGSDGPVETFEKAKANLAAAKYNNASASNSLAKSQKAAAMIAALKASQAVETAKATADDPDASEADIARATEAAKEAAEASVKAANEAETTAANTESLVAIANEDGNIEESRAEDLAGLVNETADITTEATNARVEAEKLMLNARELSLIADANDAAATAKTKAEEAQTLIVAADKAVAEYQNAASTAKTLADTASGNRSSVNINNANNAISTANAKKAAAEQAIADANAAIAAAEQAAEDASSKIDAAKALDPLKDARNNVSEANSIVSQNKGDIKGTNTMKAAVDTTVGSAILVQNTTVAAENARRAEEQRAYEAWVAAENARNGVYDPSIPKVKAKKPSAAKKGKITTKWTKLNKKKLKSSGVTHYEIWVSTDPSFPRGGTIEKTAKKSKSSLKFTGLMKNTTYYVRVRGIKWIGGTKYVGPWSQKTVKTKKK